MRYSVQKGGYQTHGRVCGVYSHLAHRNDLQDFLNHRKMNKYISANVYFLMLQLSTSNDIFYRNRVRSAFFVIRNNYHA